MSKDKIPQVLEQKSGSLMTPMDEAILEFAKKSKADNTWKSYQSDLRHFEQWCRTQHFTHLPALPKTVAGYLAHLSTTHKISTIMRRVASISQAHFMANHENPTTSAIVKSTVQGIRRQIAPKQSVRKVRPAVTSVIYKMLDPLGTSLVDIRDRALILIGFAGAFRRSELAELRFQDITETSEGLRIVLTKSKTDQAGEGYSKGLPFGTDEKTCPVHSWRAWVEASGIKDGMAFRTVNRPRKKPRNKNTPIKDVITTSISDRTIANIIKRRVEAVGLNPEEFSGHSLRAGLITEAAQRGAPERWIMKQSNHKHLPSLRGYIREGSLFIDNVAGKVGL